MPVAPVFRNSKASPRLHPWSPHLVESGRPAKERRLWGAALKEGSGSTPFPPLPQSFSDVAGLGRPFDPKHSRLGRPGTSEKSSDHQLRDRILQSFFCRTVRGGAEVCRTESSSVLHTWHASVVDGDTVGFFLGAASKSEYIHGHRY